MGYAYFPDLKSEAVVCQKPCDHPDCNAWREINTTCPICQEEVKAGAPFYYEEGQRVAHAHCVWDRVEKKEAK